MLSTYQEIISTHLKTILKKDDLIMPIVVVASSERWFVTDLCLKYGYVPVYSVEACGYFQFQAVKISPC